MKVLRHGPSFDKIHASVTEIEDCGVLAHNKILNSELL